MGLFSWGTAPLQFSLSVGSSESQKTSFGQIWTLPYLATSKNGNFGFLIKKCNRIGSIALSNHFEVVNIGICKFSGARKPMVRSDFEYFEYFASFVTS